MNIRGENAFFSAPSSHLTLASPCEVPLSACGAQSSAAVHLLKHQEPSACIHMPCVRGSNMRKKFANVYHAHTQGPGGSKKSRCCAYSYARIMQLRLASSVPSKSCRRHKSTNLCPLTPLANKVLAMCNGTCQATNQFHTYVGVQSRTTWDMIFFCRPSTLNAVWHGIQAEDISKKKRFSKEKECR